MRRLLRLLALSGLVATGACSSAKPSLTVPLTFSPEEQVSGRYPGLRAPASVRLFVAPVADERAQAETIGENTELSGRPPRPVYSTGPTAADFVGSVLARELSSVGMPVVTDESQLNRALTVTLTRFYTTESERYQTDVAATFEVRDHAGKVLWSAPASGHSDRFGRSLSTENYNQGFSDATLRMVAGVLNDPAFQRALATE
jgi:hypothetical protein